MKRLNKLLLALFVFTGSLFLFSNQTIAIETKCAESSIDVREYVAPQCDGNCSTIGGSSIGEGFAFIGNVSNFVEWINPDHFKQNSNDIHFLYEQASSTINFKQDTIWGGANDSRFHCAEAPNKEAFYRVYSSDGTWGRSILDNTMSCGDTHTSSGYIRSFEKKPDLIESNPLAPECQGGQTDGCVQSCTVPGQSDLPTTNSNQLIFQGTAICNDLNPIDVIVTTNTGGAGAGETLVYCKGYGLCAWYQTMDFEENSPADWDDTTDVCALDAATTVVNRDPYFVEPINGMYDYEINDYQDPGNLIFDKVYEDLVAQGYQAYCSIPDLKYIAESNTNDIMLENIIGSGKEFRPGSRVTVDIKDYKQFYNYIDSQTPLWRKEGIYVLKDKDSLENFWSHKDETVRDGFMSADFSPAYALLTPKSQCIEKKKILNAVNKKCSTLQNPETCALDVSYSPGSKAYWDLYKLVEDPNSNFDCSLMEQPDENLSLLQASIKNNLLNMPFTLPTSYRFAFVVYSAELKEPRIVDSPNTLWEPTTHKPGFDFLRYADKEGEIIVEPNAKPRNEIRILAFLVPDFATNQDNFEFKYTPPPEINYPTLSSTPGTPRVHSPTYPAPYFNFSDAVKIARNAIQEAPLQNNYLTMWRAIKEGATISNPFKVNGPDFVPFEHAFDPDGEYDVEGENGVKDKKAKLIECLYKDGKPTKPGVSCVAPMEKALTTFVNRRIEDSADCNEEILNWEENRTIYANAGISRGDAGLFHLYNGSADDVLSGNVHIPKGDNPVHILDNGLYPNDVTNIIDNTDDKSAEPFTDPKKKVFSFRFLSHYSFSSFYDATDPLYGDDEHEDSQKAEAVIHGYLIYPVGYELEGAEETFLRTFLTTEEIAQFEEEWDPDIAGDDVRSRWFKLKDAKLKLTSQTVTHTEKFLYKTEADCQTLFASYIKKTSDSPVHDYNRFKLDSCMKSPDASIKISVEQNLEPRILGARFGLITIKIQQALREIGTPSWNYITSCLESETPTEDFLTGRCTGIVERDGLQDNEDKPDTDYMNTELIVDVITDCAGVPRFDTGSGPYELPPSDTSCSIPDSMTGEIGVASEYFDDDHGINDWLNASDRITCGEDFYKSVGCTFTGASRPTLVSHLVDSQGNFTEDGDKTACEYVQDRAAQQNVSPKLALSIWIEESGAGAYVTESGGADFGVISQKSSRESGTIENQLRLFLGTINSNRNIAYPRFLLQYSGELIYGVDPDLNLKWSDWENGDPVLFCRNKVFPSRLKNAYEQLTGF